MTNTVPPEHLTPRLASLGFVVRAVGSVEFIAPPLCDVSEGSFLMGSDPMKDRYAPDDERPQHSVGLSAFQIGRYPVTVAEYALYIASGHQAPNTGDKLGWNDQRDTPDYPVACVSWHEARAYAAWLAELTGELWRLPTEAEWEKAARGSDGRIYPWGNAFDSQCCKVVERPWAGLTYPEPYSPVGTYPRGASPFGVEDMVGNVYEWTSSRDEPYPYRASDGHESVGEGILAKSDTRTLRGAPEVTEGKEDRMARAARRYYNRADLADFFSSGFRLIRTSR